jgi:hypothetical protein
MGLTFSLFAGVISGLTIGLSNWLTARLINRRLRIVFAVFSSLIIFGPIFGLYLGTTNAFNLNLRLAEGLSIGFSYALVVGLIGALASYQTDIQVVERLVFSRPSGSQLIKTVSRGLVTGFFEGMVIGLIIAWGSELVYLLIFGLIIGLISGVIGGVIGTFLSLIQAVKSEQKLYPNQGIISSQRNALLLFFVPIFPIALGIWFGTQARELGGLGLVLFILASLHLIVASLYFGGQSVIQHYILRVMLTRNRMLPLALIPFLDDMADRILLRRVGGGWVFIHRYLLEYFAADFNTTKDQ